MPSKLFGLFLSLTRKLSLNIFHRPEAVATQEALTYNLYHELYWFLWDEALDANSG
jgi:hypothetical protein